MSFGRRNDTDFYNSQISSPLFFSHFVPRASARTDPSEKTEVALKKSRRENCTPEKGHVRRLPAPVPRLFCENMKREIDSETGEKPTQPHSVQIERAERNYEGASTAQAQHCELEAQLQRRP